MAWLEFIIKKEYITKMMNSWGIFAIKISGYYGALILNRTHKINFPVSQHHNNYRGLKFYYLLDLAFSLLFPSITERYLDKEIM